MRGILDFDAATEATVEPMAVVKANGRRPRPALKGEKLYTFWNLSGSSMTGTVKEVPTRKVLLQQWSAAGVCIQGARLQYHCDPDSILDESKWKHRLGAAGLAADIPFPT